MPEPVVYEPLGGCPPWCPWPTSPDVHFCWVCGDDAVEHQHIEKRSHAPGRKVDPTNIAILCRDCHRIIDEGPWRNYVEDGVYTVEDEEGKVRCRVVQATGECAAPRLPSVTNEDYGKAALSMGIPGTLTATSWTPDADMTYERWAEMGTLFGRILRASAWWIGDWLRFGETKWGEKYTQAIENTGLSYEGLRNIVSVCGRVELSRRRDNLSFAHHEVVAALPAQQQEEMLERAEAEGWTRNELRQAIKAEREPDAQCIHDFVMVCRHCGRKWIKEEAS